MAEGGEVPGRLPGSAGYENVIQRVCQPCLEKDNLTYATGLCVDCLDYLCLTCIDNHKVQQHRVLDREQMLNGQTKAKAEDSCSDSCSVHENEYLQYYCASHCQFGCKKCIQFDHAACDEVHYIPHVSKELVNNEDNRQVETQLKLVLDTFMNVFRNALQNSDEVGESCNDALRELQDFKRQMDEALANFECKLKEKVKTLRLEAEQELAEMRNKYKAAHEVLQRSLAKIESLQNDNQECSSYIEMMRTKTKIKSLEDQTQHAEVDISYRQSPIKFFPNEILLELLNNPEGFGTVSSAGTRNILYGSDAVTLVSDTDTASVSSWSDDFEVISDTESLISQHALSTGAISHGSYAGGILSGSAFGTQTYHLQEFIVKTDRDKCWITGMVVLPDGRLVLSDYKHCSIKALNMKTGEVVAQRELTSRTWDITSIEKNKVAVTMPYEKKVTFLTVGDNNLSVDRQLNFLEMCFGIDYRNGKLAVTFIDPYRVQIFNSQGHVLYSISSDKSGQALFNAPCYLTFGQDDTTLYVSNFRESSVVCVKVDGTVVATYRDRYLKNPREVVLDRSGNVYVCATGSNTVHKLTKDCKNLQVWLTQADGLDGPWSICLSEEQDKLFVGMWRSDYVKVYKSDSYEPQ